ncbi:MAG: YHYH protein [Acidobacteria bacterium]|nr:YHYH protein [Acidobacteriota bacterium]
MKDIMTLFAVTAAALGPFFTISYFQEITVTADAKNRVKIYEKKGYRYIESNGIPDHTTGEFPNRGNPNRISEQDYNFKVPLNPTISPDGVQFQGAPPAPPENGDRSGPPPGGPMLFGVALNGIPFDPGTAEAWNNDLRSGWNSEALTGKLDLGVDSNNAHVQPTGAYHYHGIPVGLVENLIGKNTGGKMVLVGFAADGFPVYSQYGYAKPDDPKSGVKKLAPSYRLKTGTRPDGPKGKYDGTYLQDFEYVAGAGDLDQCNGRTGITPEYPNGIYHYYLTDTFPFIPRCLKGIADTSFQKGPPPGGRRMGRPPGGQGSPRGQRPPERP